MLLAPSGRRHTHRVLGNLSAAGKRKVSSLPVAPRSSDGKRLVETRTDTARTPKRKPRAAVSRVKAPRGTSRCTTARGRAQPRSTTATRVDTEHLDVMVSELDPSIRPPGTQPEPPRSGGAARQLQAQRSPRGVTKGSNESGRPGSNRRRPAWETFVGMDGCIRLRVDGLAKPSRRGAGASSGTTVLESASLRLHDEDPALFREPVRFTAAQTGSCRGSSRRTISVRSFSSTWRLPRRSWYSRAARVSRRYTPSSTV
jgi:hypothetical protein